MSKFLLASAFAFALVGSASAAPNIGGAISNTHKSAAHAAHRHHLEAALRDILAAEADGTAGKVQQAEQAAAAAMKQIHAAMKHHGNSPSLHQHHHSHLTAALKDLSAAEKLFKAGNAAKAERDLAKAAVQVRDALKHHHS